ncbi:MAG: ATP-binding protein [Candidatus Jordarchaeum sp.]|uniref:ATP-binding protein n=1 Tax=Candidatus Jordarchaeum sp. TaxID=2823881 RepID=UPI00404B6DF0
MKFVGTVITSNYPPSPTTSNFSFVITNDEPIPVRKGQYIQINTEDGLLLGMIQEIIKTNRFYSHAEYVKEYERGGQSLTSIFPCDRWDMLIATAKPLGIFSNNGFFDKVSFPPSPGERVYIADDEVLVDLLGLDLEHGLYLGNLRFHDVSVSLNMTRLLQKHLAILAMSGSGKSYLASVLIEELLSRKIESGRVAVVVVDVHGEYSSLANKPDKDVQLDFSDKVIVVKSPFVQFATSLISGRWFGAFQPEMSPIQVRELGRIITEMRREYREKSYSLQDLLTHIENDSKITQRTKEAMLSWLYELEDTKLFGAEETPDLENIVKAGQAVILDLSEATSLRKKQLIVSYVASRLFGLRRNGKIPPFTMILEEAHQFCPQARQELAISQSIIEQIAREGRKFYASICLLSQRPVRLSTTVLSQANTHIILRITNPNDLDTIKASSEMITSETAGMISSLPVGEALIVGSAVNFPLFVKIRQRYTKESTYEANLEQAAKTFEQSTSS